jgi:hypothetical protein
MSLGEEMIRVLRALLESHDLEYVLKILASATEYGLALACGAAVGDTTAVLWSSLTRSPISTSGG